MIPLTILFWSLAVIAVLVALTMIAVLVVAVVVFVTPRGKVSKVRESERVDIKMDRLPTANGHTINVFANADPDALGARISSQIGEGWRS